MKYPRITYAIVLLGTCAWCALILLAPLLAASSSPWAEYLYRFFRPICHQRAERSFFLFSEQLAVCVRCSSVYAGFLLGLIIYPWLRRLDCPRIPSRWLLLVVFVPVALEVATEWIGLYQSTVVTRSLTGGALGAILSFFILPTVLEAVHQLFAHPKASSPLSNSP